MPRERAREGVTGDYHDNSGSGHPTAGPPRAANAGPLAGRQNAGSLAEEQGPQGLVSGGDRPHPLI